MTYSCSLYNSPLNIRAFVPWSPICDWWARVSALVAYSWISVGLYFSCSARAVPDGLGSVNLSRNFLLRSPYFINVVYSLLSIYVAAHTATDPLKREIMYLICCLSGAPAASAILLSTYCKNIFAFRFPPENGSRWAALSVMLSVPVPAHPEGLAKLLAMGFVCCSGGVVLTRILSCQVSCWILDATPSSSTLLRRACSEGSESPEGLLDFSSLLSSSSDLLSPPLLGLLDLSEVVLLRPELTAHGPVVRTAEFSPAFSSL